MLWVFVEQDDPPLALVEGDVTQAEFRALWHSFCDAYGIGYDYFSRLTKELNAAAGRRMMVDDLLREDAFDSIASYDDFAEAFANWLVKHHNFVKHPFREFLFGHDRITDEESNYL